nr:DUF2971 domain-containing protein [uncultured Alistipes sp.]
MEYYRQKPSLYVDSDYRSVNFNGDWTKHFINDYIDSIASKGEVQTQKEFTSFKNEHLPKHLYKFMSPNVYNLINLQHQSVYLSSPRTFNDPFDSYACIVRDSYLKIYMLNRMKNEGLVSKNGNKNSISEEEYWEIFHSKGESKYRFSHNHDGFWHVFQSIGKNRSGDLLIKMNDIAMDGLRECESKIQHIRNIPYRISCFSNFLNEDELMQNTTMWSHYADHHKGFCLMYQLNFDNIIFKDAILCGLFPVKYTSRVPTLSPRELFKFDNSVLTPSLRKAIVKSLISKSKFWNYEKEWRLILNENDTAMLYNNILPFVKADAIYLGCRIEPAIRKSIVKFAAEQNIEVYQTRQCDDKFCLSCYSISHSHHYDEKHEIERQIWNIKDSIEKGARMEKLYKEVYPIIPNTNKKD